MIWLCGDTHGMIHLQKTEDFFWKLTQHKSVTKDDYLIILGDVGVCWDGGLGDDFIRARMHNLPCTVLWLDGNHENFDLLAQYPVTEGWHGGAVQFIERDIIHLMRGQVYTLEGNTFFVFGGGNSIDKGLRTPGYTWWPEEMPSAGEYDEGWRNLARVGYRVDYILTHTCPGQIASQIVPCVYSGEEDLQAYFDEISADVTFRAWYFGHFHEDWSAGNYRCLMGDIAELEPNLNLTEE